MLTNPTTQYRRWLALDGAIELLKKRYDNEDASRRENTIYMLLDQLQKFGKGHFHFFYDGLGERGQIDLQPIPDDPGFKYPQYIMGYGADAFFLERILDQMAEDIAAIQSASDQRELSKKLLEVIPGRVDVLETLIQVDKLALNALRMTHTYLPGHEPTALTYFRRSTNVRVIPYDSVALIGIPITAVGVHRGIGVAEDLLVIPHEVAHYLYWNGQKEGERIRDLVAKLTAGNPVERWTEEIFADVVGTLIAGPAAARSMVDMQTAVVGPAFLDDRGVHPTPALRPLLYAYTLDEKGSQTLADEVRTRWQAVLDERRVFVDRAQLYAAYAIIDAVLTVIDVNQFASWLRWTDNAPYDELYSRFADETRLAELADGVTDDELDPVRLDVPPGWGELAGRFMDRADLEAPLDAAIERVTADAAPEGSRLELAPDEWIRLFEFGGWTTEGPNIKGHD